LNGASDWLDLANCDEERHVTSTWSGGELELAQTGRESNEEDDTSDEEMLDITGDSDCDDSICDKEEQVL
jgi:hypothetical protein